MTAAALQHPHPCGTNTHTRATPTPTPVRHYHQGSSPFATGSRSFLLPCALLHPFPVSSPASPDGSTVISAPLAPICHQRHTRHTTPPVQSLAFVLMWTRHLCLVHTPSSCCLEASSPVWQWERGRQGESKWDPRCARPGESKWDPRCARPGESKWDPQCARPGKSRWDPRCGDRESKWDPR